MSDHRNSICLIGTSEAIKSNLEAQGFEVYQYGRNTQQKIDFTDDTFRESIENIALGPYSNYIIVAGFLQPIRIEDQTVGNISKSFLINAAGPVIASEIILARDSRARVIILGSESGRKGSFDMTYALAKSSLRMYVQTRQVLEKQQLLLVSPSTIDDMGMTLRRTDTERLSHYKLSHPKKRFLKCKELSQLLAMLFTSTLYLTNTEIEVNGGKFTTM